MRIYMDMSYMLHIRNVVFGVTQRELADIAGTKQATVSRWESGELFPDQEQMARIRDTAIERGLDWSDSWFFELPETAA